MPTFDAAASGGHDVGLTWSHTVAVQNNRILLVYLIDNDGSGAATSVDYNGDAMTRILTADFSFESIDVWYLLAPDTGTNTVTVVAGNWNGSARGFVSLSYYGVNQTTPYSDSDSTNGPTSLTTTLTTNSTDMCVKVYGQSDNVNQWNEAAHGTGETARVHTHTDPGNPTGSASLEIVASEKASTTTSTAMTTTVGQDSANQVVISLVKDIIAQASAGAISFTGTVVKSTSKVVAGAQTFTGVITKAITRSFTGAITFTGALVRQANKVIAGAISFIGALVRLRNTEDIPSVYLDVSISADAVARVQPINEDD